MRPEQFVTGVAPVLEFFGGWPTFHDTEIRELRLERQGREEFEGPVLYLVLGPGELPMPSGTSMDHSGEGAFRLTIRFGTVCELRLEGFNHQNAIMALELENISRHPLSPTAPGYRVTLEAAHGLAGDFACATVEVTEFSTHPQSG